MHYGIKKKKIACDRMGSGYKKSVEIGWNLRRHKSHQIMFVNTHTIKLIKIRQWDAGFISK